MVVVGQLLTWCPFRDITICVLYFDSNEHYTIARVLVHSEYFTLQVIFWEYFSGMAVGLSRG